MKQAGNNIYLVGMMGAGKTTIGKLLARRLGRCFLDSDHVIEQRTGVKIPHIFEVEGEPGFRRRESQVLGELAEQTDLVVATGGGIVLSEDNRACLARSGLVVYLHVPPRILWERTRNDKNRPLLQVADPRGRIEQLHAQRDPLYRAVADIVLEGGRSSPAGAARQLEQEVLLRCAA
jgi:shikimate kinase